MHGDCGMPGRAANPLRAARKGGGSYAHNDQASVVHRLRTRWGPHPASRDELEAKVKDLTALRRMIDARADADSDSNVGTMFRAENDVAAAALFDAADTTLLSQGEVESGFASAQSFMVHHGLSPYSAEDCIEARAMSRRLKGGGAEEAERWVPGESHVAGARTSQNKTAKCSACLQTMRVEDFSATQLSKKGKRRCSQCVASQTLENQGPAGSSSTDIVADDKADDDAWSKGVQSQAVGLSAFFAASGLDPERAVAAHAAAADSGAPRAAAGAPGPAAGRTMKLFHGTSWENACRIEAHGFKASLQGRLGPGVYLSREDKARRFALDASRHGGSDGGLVTVLVRITNPKFVRGDDEEGLWRQQGYDACRTEYTSMSPSMEWVVASERQISRIVCVERVSLSPDANRAPASAPPHPRVGASGRPRAKHILQYSKAELQAMGWSGEQYFSRSQNRMAPYVSDMDSDSDYSYDDVSNVAEHLLPQSWREEAAPPVAERPGPLPSTRVRASVKGPAASGSLPRQGSSGRTVRCSVCGQMKTDEDFSNRQRKAKAHGRKCLECVAPASMAQDSVLPRHMGASGKTPELGAHATLAAGSRVELHGLQRAVHLNGRAAHVLSLDAHTGRLAVELTIARPGEAHSHKVKPENLRTLAPLPCTARAVAELLRAVEPGGRVSIPSGTYTGGDTPSPAQGAPGQSQLEIPTALTLEGNGAELQFAVTVARGARGALLRLSNFSVAGHQMLVRGADVKRVELERLQISYPPHLQEDALVLNEIGRGPDESGMPSILIDRCSVRGGSDGVMINEWGVHLRRCNISGAANRGIFANRDFVIEDSVVTGCGGYGMKTRFGCERRGRNDIQPGPWDRGGWWDSYPAGGRPGATFAGMFGGMGFGGGRGGDEMADEDSESGGDSLSDDDEYGVYGFTRAEEEDLLCQGVKPWDDDAHAVLAALNGDFH